MKQATEELSEMTDTIAATTEPSGPVDDPLPLTPEHEPPEVRTARDLARRYRLPYIDVLPAAADSPIDYALLKELPVDLMLRHQFVPLRREGNRLHIAMADPTDLEK